MTKTGATSSCNKGVGGGRYCTVQWGLMERGSDGRVGGGDQMALQWRSKPTMSSRGAVGAQVLWELRFVSGSRDREGQGLEGTMRRSKFGRHAKVHQL